MIKVNVYCDLNCIGQLVMGKPLYEAIEQEHMMEWYIRHQLGIWTIGFHWEIQLEK